MNPAPAPASSKPYVLDPVNFLFLVGTPLLALVGAVWYVRVEGWHWQDLVLCAVLYCATGISITAGYHRYFSHRAYECSKAVQLFYLLFGAAAVENSAQYWCSDHRNHHRFVDGEKDPYDIMKGIFWAHMGWIFYKDRRDEHGFDNVPDLLADPLVRWQHRYYLPLTFAVGGFLPLFIGMAYGHPWGGLLWGGVVRLVACHHGTFLINSAAHALGRQPYSDGDTSRDNGWLALLTFGEGYHNFHHSFASDYRNGVRWWQWDPSKWLIASLAALGQAWRLNRISERAIQSARMSMDEKRARAHLAHHPVEGRDRMLGKLAAWRARHATALGRVGALTARYREWLAARTAPKAAVAPTASGWERRLERATLAAGLARSRYEAALRACFAAPRLTTA